MAAFDARNPKLLLHRSHRRGIAQVLIKEPVEELFPLPRRQPVEARIRSPIFSYETFFLNPLIPIFLILHFIVSFTLSARRRSGDEGRGLSRHSGFATAEEVRPRFPFSILIVFIFNFAFLLFHLIQPPSYHPGS